MQMIACLAYYTNRNSQHSWGREEEKVLGLWGLTQYATIMGQDWLAVLEGKKVQDPEPRLL